MSDEFVAVVFYEDSCDIGDIYLVRVQTFFERRWPGYEKMTLMMPSTWLLLGISELSVDTSTIQIVLIVGSP
jgi:hypothetical protein